MGPLCFELFESERAVACTQTEQEDNGVNNNDQFEGCDTMHLQVAFVEERKLWVLRPIKDCWDKTGKASVSARWVDTNKGGIK